MDDSVNIKFVCLLFCVEMSKNDQENISKLEIEALKRKERLRALKRKAESDKNEDDVEETNASDPK